MKQEIIEEVVEENDENIVKNVKKKKNEGDIVAETLKEMVGKIEKNASQSIETQSIQKKTPKTKPKKKKEKVELPPPQTKISLQDKNPKKKGSKSAARYDVYKTAKTLAEFTVGR